MTHVSAHLRLWLGLIACVCLAISPVFAADSEPESINPREPRAQIRTEILARTKLGSSPTEVLKFISENFQPKAETPAPTLMNHPAVGPTANTSNKKGVQSIRLVLGHYYTSPALLLLPTPMVAETTAVVQWAFDKDGKLIEVFVDKDTELGDTTLPDE